ncbi:MAG: SDR family NAD(P)-dependent oxidoreductase [Solirubrobacterales bacterium]
MKIHVGTRAIVTGASKGIGRATAKALAGRGAKLGLIARGAEGLEQLAAEIGDGATALPADVADRESINAAVEKFVDQAGGLDIVVANAGIARYAPFTEQDPEDVERMVMTNVLGTINTVRAGLEPMLDSASGHIVVLSSGAGLRAFPWGAVYGATKAADKAFAEALRHELSGTGVSLTTVFPGEVATSLHDEATQLPDWRNSKDAIPPELVASATIEAIEEDRRELHIPASVRLLAINDIAPGLLDRMLALVRGGAAAPRRY